MKRKYRLLTAVIAGMLAIVMLCGCWWWWDRTPRDEFGDTYTNEVQAYQTEMLELVNAEREKQGIAPLTLAGDIVNGIAQQRAQELEGKFSHERADGTYFYDMLDGSSIKYTCSGENIAYGLNSMTTSEGVMQSWMSSSGHRANILNEDYKKLAVGCYVRSGDMGVYYYWVQIFIG